MNRYHRTCAFLVAFLLLSFPAARAADQLVPGTKLLLKSANGRETLSFKSRGPLTAPTPGSGDDPRNGGATLQVFNPGTTESFTFSLPSTHWSLAGTTFRYLDSAMLEAGKVRVAIIGRILKVSGKKTGITLDEATQGTLDVVLTSGTIRYCATFGAGSVKRDQPGSFIAHKASAPGSCPAPPPTTSTTTSTTTSSTMPGATTSTSVPGATTTTTSTIPGSCDCCACTGNLKFTTGLPQIGIPPGCGKLLDDTSSTLLTLDCGGLYFGGSGETVPLPSVVPDQGVSLIKVTTCDTGTGALTLDATTNTDTGSFLNCTSASGTNQYGMSGCLFGPPLPIPNTSSPTTSTCVVNRVATSATGSGNCNDGSSDIDIPLLSDIYLTGPTAGLIPCPRCDTMPGPGFTCQAGPNNGQPCTPGDSAGLGSPYPTTHDCPPDSAAFIGSLPIPFALTSGTQTKTAQTLSGGAGQSFVFCGFCGQQFAPSFQGPPAVPCTADSQCTSAPNTKCRQNTDGAFGQGPARTITETGSPAGVCIGDGATHDATLVSVFCIPPSFNGTVDQAASLPGPGAVALPGTSQLLGCPATTTSTVPGTTTSTSNSTSTSVSTTTSTSTAASTTSTTLLPPQCGTFPTCGGSCPTGQVCSVVFSANTPGCVCVTGAAPCGGLNCTGDACPSGTSCQTNPLPPGGCACLQTGP